MINEENIKFMGNKPTTTDINNDFFESINSLEIRYDGIKISDENIALNNCDTKYAVWRSEKIKDNEINSEYNGGYEENGIP